MVEQEDHPVNQLLTRPNQYTSGSLLANYIITALFECNRRCILIQESC